MRILIAEDDKVTQSLHKYYMSKWGFHFDLAHDGKEAVELFTKNPERYDIILMDVDMPNMNGIAATQEIRKLAPDFPIIAMSANLSNEQGCMNAGADMFLSQPCLTDDLKELIEALTTK